jgi:hypothetical protein
MMTKFINVRKNGKYTNVISVTRNVQSGTPWVIREIADREYSDKKILVISKPEEKKKSEDGKRVILKEEPKPEVKEGIKEYKTPDGRLIMREKRVNARKESSSTVLTMTGFVEPGMYYWIDMGPAFVIKQPTFEEIQTELAKRNLWGEE